MSHTNANWDHPPNEIMNLITGFCGLDCSETEWMFVNKHWFDYYLSKVYHTVSIDLSTSNNDLDKILHSEFDIGKWVKYISFTKLQPPKDVYQINRSDDPLHLLMERTPNVEEVEFSCNHTYGASDWTYFSVILLGSNSWKLLALPKIPENKLYLSGQYFACAYEMRSSLKQMNLSLGMMNVSNYDSLKDFPTLEVLNIGKGIANDFVDLDFALQSLPNLKGIAAKFTEGIVDPLRSEPKNRYPDLQEIQLENFTPNIDKEVMAFTKCFPNLVKVKIVGKKHLPWPAYEVDPVVTDYFFDFLSFISEYQITVTGDIHATDLIKKWAKWAKPIRKDSIII